MLTQNKVIKVETCSIHIGFGCKYKYAVKCICSPAMSTSMGLLCCALLGEAFVFCLKTGCTTYFQPTTLLSILLRFLVILA